MICCICKKEFHGFFNNPEGAVWKKNGNIELLEFKENDVCCDECNSKFVIPGRRYRISLQEKVGKDEN